jgi:hypothetical protein
VRGENERATDVFVSRLGVGGHRRGVQAEIQLNYCVAIYEEGAVCNICVDAGAHGTHVVGDSCRPYPTTGSLSTLIRIGRAVLAESGCAECHVGVTRAE